MSMRFEGGVVRSELVPGLAAMAIAVCTSGGGSASAAFAVPDPADRPAEQAIPSAQAEIDRAIGAIEMLLQTDSPFLVEASDGTGTVVVLNSGVVALSVDTVNASIPTIVPVSAFSFTQPATLFLGTRTGEILTVGADDPLKLLLTSNRGSRQIELTSGTSIASVRDVINGVGPSIGVRALPFYQRVDNDLIGSIFLETRLESVAEGPDGFVSVQVIDDAGSDTRWLPTNGGAIVSPDIVALNRGNTGLILGDRGALFGEFALDGDVRRHVNGLVPYGREPTDAFAGEIRFGEVMVSDPAYFLVLPFTLSIHDLRDDAIQPVAKDVLVHAIVEAMRNQRRRRIEASHSPFSAPSGPRRE